MTVPVIHEASEIESTTLDGCPLAIEAEEKVFDKPEIEYDRPIPLPDVHLRMDIGKANVETLSGFPIRIMCQKNQIQKARLGGKS